MEWFDTHAHLTYPELNEGLSDFLDMAAAAGVVGIVAVGTDLDSSRRCVQLADAHPLIWAAVGIHPNESAKQASADWAEIQTLANGKRVVGLGETGLDLYWDDAPLAIQIENFRRHLDFSRQCHLPVIIHMRDCEQEMLAVLREARHQGPLRGVMHSFTGSAETAAECQAMGLYLSFAGMATFKKSDSIRQVAANVAADRILIETDAPFLAPHPHRGLRPNHPALVVHTGRCLAEVRGMSESDFAALSTENARRLFLNA